MVAPAIFAGLFDSHDVARFFDDTDDRVVAASVGANRADHTVRKIEALLAKLHQSLSLNNRGGQALDFAQAYSLGDEPGHGVEIFSLIRRSSLPPKEYIDRHFDTGTEHQSSSDS